MPQTSTSPTIYYELDGDPAGEPMVLISGLTAQLIGWRDGFVETLTDRGMVVIRPDNRDVGLSEQMGGPGDLGHAYSIDDMALDICRVLDAEGIGTAHIVGQSMGGVIAQAMAINHPDRVRSLGLIYTAPAFSPQFLTEMLQQIFVDPPSFEALPRAETVEAYVEGQRFSSSPGYAFDEAWMRELGARGYDRCNRPDGHARQSMAVAASGDRSLQLSSISVPTAVIHGDSDQLVRPEAGIALARLIPGAELHIYAGMGHEIVEPLWGEFADILVRTAKRVTRKG